MASMDGSGSNINRDKILAKARELIDNVEAAVEDQIAAHKVEKKRLSELLAIGFMLMSYLFERNRSHPLRLNRKKPVLVSPVIQAHLFPDAAF